MTRSFTDAELDYLNGQPLGRLATVGRDGSPHVTPVGFFYEPEGDAIVIGGHGLAESRKFRDARRRAEVALVVDDLASTDPWTPRGIEIRGYAETHADGGGAAGRRLDAPFPFDDGWIRIRPRRIRAWGIDGGPDGYSARDAERAAEILRTPARTG